MSSVMYGERDTTVMSWGVVSIEQPSGASNRLATRKAGQAKMPLTAFAPHLPVRNIKATMFSSSIRQSDAARQELLLEGGTRVSEDLEATTVSQLHWHLLPLMSLVVLVTFMDRAILGFVASSLCKDLGIGHTRYGLVVALFSAGYISSQVPSNYLLRSMGARSWFAVMLISWGLVASSLSFVQKAYQFYALRLLMGFVGGGSFSSPCYFLSVFYPVQHLTFPYAALGATVAAATPLISVAAVGLLSIDELFGWSGWRLLFLVDGMVPFVCGFVLLWLLPSTPEKASFLSPEQKMWIRQQNSCEAPLHKPNLLQEAYAVFQNKLFWVIIFYGFIRGALFAAAFYWTTLIIRSMSGSNEDSVHASCDSSASIDVASVALTAVPFSIAAVSVLLFGRLTSNVLNRPKVAGWILGSSGIFLIGWVLFRHSSFIAALLFLSLAISCFMCPNALIVGVVGSLFDNETRATAVAVLNATEGIGMVAGPIAIGYIVDHQGYDLTVSILAAAAFVAGLALLAIKDPLRAFLNHEIDGGARPEQDSLV